MSPLELDKAVSHIQSVQPAKGISGRKLLQTTQLFIMCFVSID